MMKFDWHALRFWWVRCVGRFAVGMRPARVTKIIAAGNAIYRKRRVFYSEALVIVGNLWLRCCGSSLRGLTRKQWLAWETKLAWQLYGVQLYPDRRGALDFPQVSGRSLAAILSDSNCVDAAKAAALTAAVTALRYLHRLETYFPDRHKRALSHTDAQARNVIVDEGKGVARWLDFESVHEGNRSAAWRHADDLRALAFSAAHLLGPRHFHRVAQIVVQAYYDQAVLAEFENIVRAVREKPNPFHLGQAPFRYRAHTRFCEVMIVELEGCVHEDAAATAIVNRKLSIVNS